MKSSHLLHLQQCLQDFYHTGAILPSSQSLASAMVLYLAQKAAPVNVLEVGPGTGAFTQEIVGFLGPEDRLDIVEINHAFVEYLRQWLRTDPVFFAGETHIELFLADIQRCSLDRSYDFIIMGLPLSNFSAVEVENILTTVIRFLAPGGTLSFFQYRFLTRGKYVIGNTAQRQSIRSKQEVIDCFAARYQVDQRTIWNNFPPARICYWQKPKEKSR